MTQISASDVSKLRKLTGAGMMDCKKALEEANGDIEKAIEIIRKKGQAIATKRADREASEGAVLAKTNNDNTKGVVIALNCETDFVARNSDFLSLANKILDIALEKFPLSLDELKNLEIEGKKISEKITELIGIIGEKIELSYYDYINAPMVIAYIHQGNKLATLVGFNKKTELQVAKDIAMQVAAMNPVAIDVDDVPQEIIEKEKEIGKEQARQEGKPENMLDKIAEGKLKKFFQESTLLNQQFTKDNKITIRQYLESIDKELKVLSFKRYTLSI